MSIQNVINNPSHHYVRHAEKTQQVLDWLGEHRYSTAAIMASLLGIGVNPTRRFLNRLQQKGFVQSLIAPTQRAPIWMLTAMGKATMSAQLGKRYLWPTDRSKVSFHALRHDLFVQSYLLSRLTPYDDYVTEARLKSDLKIADIHSRQKVPDLVLIRGQARHAIEMELTAKSTDRIYRAFYEYFKALKEGRYQTVTYVFEQPTLREKYQVLFDRPLWPTFRYHGKHQKLLPRVDSHGRRVVFEVLGDGVVQRFKFNQAVIS